MPRTMRSPPQSSPNTRILPETQSEPDLSEASAPCSATRGSANVSTRPHKRFRGDESDPESDRFEELKVMLQSWKDDQDTILHKLVADVAELKRQNLTIRNSNLEIEKSISFFNKSYEDMKTRIEALENVSKENEVRLRDLATSNSEQSIARLEAKIDLMEQQARQCNIEICNVPEKRNENLLTTVELIGNAVKFPISYGDILSVHRVPHAQQTDHKPKNIIVKLKSRIMRDNLLSAYRKIKSVKSDQLNISGAPVPVYLNEHLTLKNKALFRKTRDIAYNNGYKYIWISNATILVRERDGMSAFAIRSDEDLHKIVSRKKTVIDTTK